MFPKSLSILLPAQGDGHDNDFVAFLIFTPSAEDCEKIIDFLTNKYFLFCLQINWASYSLLTFFCSFFF